MDLESLVAFAGRHYILSALFVLCLVMLIYTQIRIMLSPVKAISSGKATDLINNANAVSVDLRTDKEFAAGHITGAVNLPVKLVNEGNFGAIDRYRNVPLVIVDQSGVSSFDAARTIRKAGFPEVYALAGGIGAWTDERMPLVKH
ncbi:MAG: rhodanese-like domain-containing protein [Succinivibrionaceae bacterium]|nr:rhodanese-like domain-containing protein [Succinivibrionaceae bacterium]MDY3145111.1 rhodanese-like domain-containing protein [Succinivibrionaceae bacterium]